MCALFTIEFYVCVLACVCVYIYMCVCATTNYWKSHHPLKRENKWKIVRRQDEALRPNTFPRWPFQWLGRLSGDRVCTFLLLHISPKGLASILALPCRSIGLKLIYFPNWDQSSTPRSVTVPSIITRIMMGISTSDLSCSSVAAHFL